METPLSSLHDYCIYGEVFITFPCHTRSFCTMYLISLYTVRQEMTPTTRGRGGGEEEGGFLHHSLSHTMIYSSVHMCRTSWRRHPGHDTTPGAIKRQVTYFPEWPTLEKLQQGGKGEIRVDAVKRDTPSGGKALGWIRGLSLLLSVFPSWFQCETITRYREVRR